MMCMICGMLQWQRKMCFIISCNKRSASHSGERMGVLCRIRLIQRVRVTSRITNGSCDKCVRQKSFFVFNRVINERKLKRIHKFYKHWYLPIFSRFPCISLLKIYYRNVQNERNKFIQKKFNYELKENSKITIRFSKIQVDNDCN